MRGIDPMMTDAKMSTSVTVRPRGSVPNTTGANTSAVPRRSSGHAGWSAVVMSSSPTYSASAPGWRLWIVSGHTVPSWRRRPLARFSRRSDTSPAVTPCGRSSRASHPGPSRWIGSMSTMALARSLARAWLIPARRRPSRARTTTSNVSVSYATGTVAEVRIGLSSGWPNHASSGSTTRAIGTHAIGMYAVTVPISTSAVASSTASTPPRNARRLTACLCSDSHVRGSLFATACSRR